MGQLKYKVTRITALSQPGSRREDDPKKTTNFNFKRGESPP